jgi:hypothetical protein
MNGSYQNKTMFPTLYQMELEIYLYRNSKANELYYEHQPNYIRFNISATAFLTYLIFIKVSPINSNQWTGLSVIWYKADRPLHIFGQFHSNVLILLGKFMQVNKTPWIIDILDEIKNKNSPPLKISKMIEFRKTQAGEIQSIRWKRGITKLGTSSG